MPDTKKFDVFLSHHSSDKPWVTHLKNALERKGCAVWLDKDEIRPGDFFGKALEDGLQSSQCIVFVVTESSMKSKWVEEEYYRALSLSKSEMAPVRLIPIIYQIAELPGFLNSRNWVDFRNEQSYSESLDQLIYGITGVKSAGGDTGDTLEIPFITAAMTLSEARELFEMETQKAPTFLAFKELLSHHISFDHTTVYGENRDGWKFAPHPEEAITKIVWDILFNINVKQFNTPGTSVFKCRFDSENFFSNDFDTYTHTWETLKSSGCVLIVDAVSLFHPDVIRRLRDFHVEPNDNVAMVVISPLDVYSHPVTRMIENELQNQLKMAYVKFERDMDIQCDFEIGNVRSLARWATSALPELAKVMRNKKLKPSNRDYIRKKMGDPTGIDKLIFGTGSGT